MIVPSVDEISPAQPTRHIDDEQHDENESAGLSYTSGRAHTMAPMFTIGMRNTVATTSGAPVAAVTAVTAPVAAAAILLVATAGAAHAEAQPTTFTNADNTLQVIYSGNAMSLFATVIDITNPPGATQTCRYHAVGVMATPPFPHDISTLVTGPHPSAPMPILVAQLGRTWSVTVTCNGTGNTATYSPVVY